MQENVPKFPIVSFADRYKNLFTFLIFIAGATASAGGAYLGVARAIVESRYAIKEVALTARMDNTNLQAVAERIAAATEAQLIVLDNRVTDLESTSEQQHVKLREDLKIIDGKIFSIVTETPGSKK